MRRLNLSTKMLVAALPLILAVAALLALTVRSDLAEIDRADTAADLGGMWQPLITSLNAIEAEADAMDAADPAMRQATDSAINDLRESATVLGAAEAAGAHITTSRSSISAARRNLDIASISPDLAIEIDPAEAYARASRELVAVGQLLPSEAGDPELGRELLAVVKLAEAKLAANGVVANIGQWQADGDPARLNAARDDFAELSTVLGEFEAIAPDDWASQFRQAGFTTALAGFRSQLDQVVRDAQSGQPATYDLAPLETLVDGGVQFQTAVSNSIVERAEAEAADARSATLQRIGIALGAALLAGLLAWLISRSITKRIRAVADGANRVATEQLPALVEALQDPRGQGSLPAIEPIPAKGDDELAELATAFNSMQDTVVNVAHEQVEVLRRGVSDIFVTMARRNRSLIDRQLALLDEFEAEVDDPAVLANYYQLDHMATRMRRNSESLLVLANAEPKRRRVKATEVDDVVRAAIGEVEDYRRIEIEALESLQVRGNVVADVSHLLAELLDNATSFSPPDSDVRVGGRLTDQGYMLRIVDSGVGISTSRLRDLNQLLREPPVVGLSVESTLGISVVSLLANKHGIGVTLAAGNPGLIVDVILPQTLFGPIDAHQPMGASAPVATGQAAAYTPAPIDQPAIVAWNDADGETADESFEQLDPYQPIGESPSPASSPAVIPLDDDRPVVASDWREMSLNLAAFQNGMRSANGDEPDGAEAPSTPGTHDTNGDATSAGDTSVDSTEPADAERADAEPSTELAHGSDDFPHPAPTTAGLTARADAAPPAVGSTSGVPAIDDEPDEAPTLAPPVEPATSPSLPDLFGDRHQPEPVVDEEAEALALAEALAAVEQHERASNHPVATADTADVTSDDERRAATAESGDEVASTDDSTGERDQPIEVAESGDRTTTDDDDNESGGGAAEGPIDTTDAPTGSATAGATGEPLLPPVGPRPGEFDVPPAPPMTATSPSRGPVTPETARPAPHVPTKPSEAPLPSRVPGRGPDGGPDRLGATNDAEAQPSEVPTFEAPAVGRPTDSGLPSRIPGQGPDGGPDRLADVPAPQRSQDLLTDLEEPSSTVPPTDPDSLRDRLRAFQAEFKSAADAEPGHDDEHNDHTGGHDHLDLGGDRR